MFTAKNIKWAPTLNEDALDLTLKDLTQARIPQKHLLAYFEEYFENNGSVIHPSIGDLKVLLAELAKQWDTQNKGLNLVGAFIANQLKKIEKSNSISLVCLP